VNNQPHHNIEAEQALLGAILLENGAYGAAVKHVQTEDFYEPAHAQIYDQMSRLITAGKLATPITLKNEFPDIEMPGGITISEYLARLCAEATTIINAPDYAQVIHNLSVVRSIVAVTGDLQRAPQLGYNTDEALQVAFEKLDTLRANLRGADDDAAPIGALADGLVKRMAAGDPEKGQSITTGFSDLDKKLGGGYRAGRLFVLAGRPGSGKTVFSVASSRRVARKAGTGVIFFSHEMPQEDIMARFVASELAMTSTPLDYRDILVGELTEFERGRVAWAAETLKQLPIFIDCTAGLSMFEIGARARLIAERWRRQGIKLGLIIVDYLGLVKVADRYKGNKVDELGDVARSGKILASELQTTMLMLAQLNRGVEQRDDKRPIMSDLRASGEIEEHADVVGLLYRPGYYDQRNSKIKDLDADALAIAKAREHRLDLNLDKNRLGPTSSVPLWCDVAKSAIENGDYYS
jgi:replicative DNA helicase